MAKQRKDKGSTQASPNFFDLGFEAAEQADAGSGNGVDSDLDIWDFPEESAVYYFPIRSTPLDRADCPRFAAFRRGFLAFIEQGLEGANASDNIKR